MTDAIEQTVDPGTSRSRLGRALDYLALGWAPIPLRSRDKRPIVPWEESQSIVGNAPVIGGSQSNAKE
jgi:hypothetical protein